MNCPSVFGGYRKQWFRHVWALLYAQPLLCLQCQVHPKWSREFFVGRESTNKNQVWWRNHNEVKILFSLLLMSFSMSVAVLALVPWVLRNPWNFRDGFWNPWILSRLLSKCNETRCLKSKYFWKINKLRIFLHSFYFEVISPLKFEEKYFWNPWIWCPNAATAC